MKLERLVINAARSFDTFKGYQGEITFDDEKGKVQIQTGDEMSRAILEVCAKELIAAAQQVAYELTANIIEQAEQPAIEGPTKEGNT